MRAVARARLVFVSLLSLLALIGCSAGEDALRARFRDAVIQQDLVAAREAALELGRALPDTPEAAIEVGRMLADIGEMNEARWRLRAALERRPGDLDLLLGLAETSLLVGDAAAALDALAALPAGAPRAPYVALLRARAIVMTGRLEEGLAALVDAEARHDEPVLFRRERIDLLATEGRHAEALGIVREMQADAAVPGDVRPWLALRESELVLRVEGGEAALRLLDAILEADPGAVEAARSRTSILISLGRATQASADLERALAAHPELAALHALAAQAALAAGDLDAAERHLRRHAEAEPTPATLVALAQFLHQQGRVREAMAALETVPEHADPLQRAELRHQRIAMQIEAGDLERARGEIEEFARAHPHDPRLDYLRARLDLAEGRPADAAQRLALVLSRLDRTDVRHLLGVALERSGDLAGAEVRYGIVTLQGPSEVSSWAGLLRVLEAQQKWERLASTAQVAARIAAIRDDALQALARALLALGRVAEAEAVAREHLGERPDLVGPRVALASALRLQGRLDEALRVIDEAGEPQRRDPRLVTERSTVLGAAGRAAEALAALGEAGAADLATPGLRHARIYLLFASGRAPDAVAEARRAMELDPEDPEPHRMLADHLASSGGFDASLEHYRRAVELAPAAGGVWFRMAIALERAGHHAEATRAYRRAIELDEHAVGPRNNLALALQRDGRLREAIEVAQAAYARAEHDPVVIDTLASLYLEAGLSRRAAAMLEKARRLDPGSPDVAFHLALAYGDLGRRDEARRLLQDLAAREGGAGEWSGRIDDAMSSLR